VKYIAKHLFMYSIMYICFIDLIITALSLMTKTDTCITNMKQKNKV